MPRQFLEVRVQRLGSLPSLDAFCAGYESKKWRNSELARTCMQWLPEFALRESECSEIDSDSAVERIGEAASLIYTTKKFLKRGELGEILLHMVIRETYNTYPAISKIYYKDARNDTVKGFDCVHVREDGGNFELWLGEAKLYKSFDGALRAAVKGINEHLDSGYMRGEFAAILRKMDPNHQNFDQLNELLSQNTSLDKIFPVICIPVFITYDSEVVGRYESVTKQYESQFEQEVEACFERFCDSDLPDKVVVRLFLLPVESRARLVLEFDRRLKACQESLN